MAVSSICFIRVLVLPCVLAELGGQCNLQHISSHCMLWSASFNLLFHSSFSIFPMFILNQYNKKMKMLVCKAGYPCLLGQNHFLSAFLFIRLIAGGLIQPQVTTDLKQRHKYLSSSGHWTPESSIYLD